MDTKIPPENYWSPKFALGLPAVDSEHRALLACFEMVERAIRAFPGNPYHVEVQIRRLISFTRKHLAHEEAVMDHFCYPGTTAHREQHEVLLGETERLLIELQAAIDLKYIMPTLKQLRHSTELHIIHDDRVLADYINGVKTPADDEKNRNEVGTTSPLIEQ